jgi:hypothetical protein
VLNEQLALSTHNDRQLLALSVSPLALLAWAEKNLHSEFAYQYHTMLSLFENAHVRVSSTAHSFPRNNRYTGRSGSAGNGGHVVESH